MVANASASDWEPLEWDGLVHDGGVTVRRDGHLSDSEATLCRVAQVDDGVGERVEGDLVHEGNGRAGDWDGLESLEVDRVEDRLSRGARGRVVVEDSISEEGVEVEDGASRRSDEESYWEAHFDLGDASEGVDRDDGRGQVAEGTVGSGVIDACI